MKENLVLILTLKCIQSVCVLMEKGKPTKEKLNRILAHGKGFAHLMQPKLVSFLVWRKMH